MKSSEAQAREMAEKCVEKLLREILSFNALSLTHQEMLIEKRANRMLEAVPLVELLEVAKAAGEIPWPGKTNRLAEALTALRKRGVEL